MKWNSNVPMKLLAHMPACLTKSNIEAIQTIIDNDKQACGTLLGSDLCGQYAPFCALCDKSMESPCAVAYIRMKLAQDVRLELAISDDKPDCDENLSDSISDIKVDEPICEVNTESQPEFVKDVLSDKFELAEEFEKVEQAEPKEILTEQTKRIRIAVAKRKE